MTNQKESRNRILRKVQLLESNLGQVIEREQRVNQALEELRSAQEHVGTTDEPMRLIGNILVSQPKEDLEEYIQKQISQKENNLEKITKSKEKLQKEIESLKEGLVQ